METEMEDILYESIPNSRKDHGCDMFAIRRFFQLLKIIFTKKICITFVVLICLMALLEQFLIYYLGIIPSGFFTILIDKNWNAFWLQVLKATLIILAKCFVMSCMQYIGNIFYVTSRDVLTNKLHSLYFSNNRFYFINTFKYSLTDNPDQRITQDVDKFCKQFSQFINPIVVAPFTISYYTYDCFVTSGWIGPICIFAVFLISATLNKLLMKPIVAKVIQQEKWEGFFRFKHMHVRTHAESIAFQDANCAEMSRANSKLFNLIKTQQGLYLREFPLNIAVKVFNYMGSIVSYLILAHPIFSGKYDDLSPADLGGLISKNAFVSIYLISCFSSLIDLSSNISEIGGLVYRICELFDVLNAENHSQPDSMCHSKLKLKPQQFPGDSGICMFELRDVTICPPNSTKPLVSDLCLQIATGSDLLITGKSSSGKTSIFRVIKGLWPAHSGHIVRNAPFLPSFVFFLPQHPLLSDGTLLEQILYPLQLPKFLKLKDDETEVILSLLKFVDLEHLLEKVGLYSEVDWNWYDMLSPGEAQRLSFVRLFYHRPQLAFIDEATSAIGLVMEDKIFRKCQELGITMVSTGHRESLLQYHNNVLYLDGEGGWTLSPIQSTSEL